MDCECVDNVAVNELVLKTEWLSLVRVLLAEVSVVVVGDSVFT